MASKPIKRVENHFAIFDYKIVLYLVFLEYTTRNCHTVKGNAQDIRTFLVYLTQNCL